MITFEKGDISIFRYQCVSDWLISFEFYRKNYISRTKDTLCVRIEVSDGGWNRWFQFNDGKWERI